MRSLLGLLHVVGIGTTLLGQGVVPPFQLGHINRVPGLNPGSLPGSAVFHVHMVHVSGAPANVFYCTATVAGLPGTHGGVAGLDLVCGSYDALADVFTPNGDAAALNSGGDECGLMVHHTALFAVFERGSGITREAWLASRPGVGQPWQAVGRIQIQCPSAYAPQLNPALADYRGQPHLVYVRNWVQAFPHLDGIVMAPISLATASIAGADTILVATPAAVGSTMSLLPVTDPNGEILGVSHSMYSYTPSLRIDRYMSLDLDPSTPPVLMYQNTSPTLTGGFVGGRFFDVEGTQVAAADTVWSPGGRSAVGGTMHVRLLSPPTSGPQIYLSLFACSWYFLAVGQSYPPVQGLLGICPASVSASPMVVHDNRNGEAVIRFPVPNSPTLGGLHLSLQPVTMELSQATVFLGNTALLVVE